jgi:hypothetical protein
MYQPKVTPQRISLRSPNCRARLRADPKLLGRECTCPRCRSRVVVEVRHPSDADIYLIGTDER